jgi:hypothetical protein
MEKLTKYICCLFLLLSCESVLAQVNEKVFVSEMRNVIAEQEWNREIIAYSAGTIDCKIKNEMGRMSVTLIADRSYKAIILRDRSQFVQSDIVFTNDFPDGEFIGGITVSKKGKYWFIIQNGTDKPSEISLECSSKLISSN